MDSTFSQEQFGINTIAEGVLDGRCPQRPPRG